MIAHISGEVAEKFGNSVIVDVHGVGYELALTAIDAETTVVGKTYKFYTYHSVRENGEDRYGFSSLKNFLSCLSQLTVLVQKLAWPS